MAQNTLETPENGPEQLSNHIATP